MQEGAVWRVLLGAWGRGGLAMGWVQIGRECNVSRAIERATIGAESQRRELLSAMAVGGVVEIKGSRAEQGTPVSF